MTTPALARVMAEMATPEDLRTIVDPAAGRGELLQAACERAESLSVTPDRVYGVEVDTGLAEEMTERLGDRADVLLGDFMGLDLKLLNPTFVIANPPYGGSRELDFFVKCDREAKPGTLLVFLMPLSFVDRVPDVQVELLTGRPLGVTTGHAIVVHRAGNPFTIRAVRGQADLGTDPEFDVLTGLKIYERGAGTPTQSAELIQSRPYSSELPVEGWLPCLRTGDLDESGVKPARLWVDYGPRLASPKTIDRFRGPRLVMRRMPLWGGRRLCAHFVEETVLCAGDLLVIKHRGDDTARLVALAEWLGGDLATELIHRRRPTVKHRDSFPKISAKDVYWLLAEWRRLEVHT